MPSVKINQKLQMEWAISQKTKIPRLTGEDTGNPTKKHITIKEIKSELNIFPSNRHQAQMISEVLGSSGGKEFSPYTDSSNIE